MSQFVIQTNTTSILGMAIFLFNSIKEKWGQEKIKFNNGKREEYNTELEVI